MDEKKKPFVIAKEILTFILIFLLGAVGVVFSVLFIETFESGFLYDYGGLIKGISVALITLCTVLAFVFRGIHKNFIYKCCYIVIIFAAVALVGLYLLSRFGFWEKITSVEEFREFIDSFGGAAVFIFILIQFAQVVLLPIPSFITVGASVLCFGPFWGAVYSFIGSFIGSVVAFAIGRVFGYKVARWLVGKENLDKAIASVKGKDRAVLTFMFLFPFFPDDVLCFVAGLSSMTWLFYLIMIFITRLISIFTATFSMNNSIIPYDTWWGLLLWGVVIAVTVLATVWIYKKGDKIEAFFTKRLKSKKARKDITK
ncbi:MAG: TVP38/TMEM64 family protein [Firmicutes bacterium]|nr:TVP38/TMEM64 family protein [Bacillota bacterium]